MRTKFSGLLTLLLALVVQVTFAQQKTISGTVTDSDGLPLPGVNILVQGTTTGTQTDFDGKYTIQASEGQTLVFSYLGLKNENRVIGASNTINVQMVQDAQALDEVVVTALGIKREKQAIGFAQQSVGGDDLVNARQTDISNALAGKVAGVQFVGAPSTGFGNSQIRLRGDTNVLYIVDGVKINSSSDIITDDIEEMSVLKGAAATALYGPLGKNGVIIITTKSAKDGQSTININHSTAMENLYVLPDYQNEYGGGYSQDFNVFNFNPANHPADWAAFDGQPMVEYYADESWGPRLDGQLVRHWDSWIVGDPEFGQLRPWSPQPNNIKNFFDTGVTNNTAITFTKGGEDYSIRAAIANIDRTGIMPNSDRRQVQGSVNARLDLSEKLTATLALNYQDRRTKNFPDNQYNNLGANFNQWFQRQLDMDRLRNYRRNGQIVSWNINSPTNTQPLYWDMPYFETHENLNFQTKNAVYGKVGLAYEFTDYLNASIELRKSYNAYESNDRFAWGGLGNPFYSENESTNSLDEIFGIINFQRDLSEDFDLAASIGFENAANNSKSIAGSTVGGLTTEGFYSLNTSVDRPNLSSSKVRSKRQSVFSKVSLGYKGILYLDGSARLDWSSTADPDNNRVETYGGSLSFIFSKLLPQNDILSFGKLRASIAQAPSFPGAYAIAETYATGTPFGSKGAMSVRGTFPNPNLLGGVREEIELGGELKFLQNRIGLDVTYFEKTDKELPVSISLDGATGYTSTRSNEGEQFYKGFEVALNLVPFRTEDFNWDISLNFATLKRHVNRIADGVDVNVLSTSWRGLQLQARKGDEWGTLYGRKYQRDADGNILLSSSGTPQYDTNQYLGNILPDFTGGIINNIRYKNFNLGLDFDFQKGGAFFSASTMFNNYSGLGQGTVGNNELGNPVRDIPVGSGGPASVVAASDAQSNSGGVLIEGVDMTSGAPASYYVNASTYWGRLFALHEEWLYEASYFKLRTVRLDYTLPKTIIEKTPFSDVNVGVFANNVWLIHSDVPGIDPSEVELRSGYPWAEDGQLPSTRTIGFNVKLTF